MFLEIIGGHYTYILVFLLLAIGFYMMAANNNLIKKIIGLNLFQTAIFLFFISLAYVGQGNIPVVQHGQEEILYANPLPHVIVLTAIVVGVAVTAVALALSIRIYEEYGTLNEKEIEEVIKLES